MGKCLLTPFFIKPTIDCGQYLAGRVFDAPTAWGSEIVIYKLHHSGVTGSLALVTATDTIGNTGHYAFMSKFLVVVRNLNQNSVLVLRSLTSERSTAVFYFESCDWHIHTGKGSPKAPIFIS